MRAKEAEGIELTDEEERKLGGAEYRQRNDRKAERKADNEAKKAKADAEKAKKVAAVTAPLEAMSKALDSSAKHSQGLRPLGTGYVPPQLLAAPMPRAEGGDVRGVMPLWEPPGMQLHQTDDGHAFLAMAPASSGGAGITGMATEAANPVVARVPVSKESAQAPKRKQSEEEIRRAARELEAQMREEHEQRMAAGPAVGIARMGR